MIFLHNTNVVYAIKAPTQAKWATYPKIISHVGVLYVRKRSDDADNEHYYAEEPKVVHADDILVMGSPTDFDL